MANPKSVIEKSKEMNYESNKLNKAVYENMFRCILIFLISSFSAFGQQIIQGQIVDKETSLPIPFASIGIVGSSKGTSSNLNGEFSLAIPESTSIKVSCVGYESVVLSTVQEFKLIKLKPVSTQLGEVVVFERAVNPKKIVRRAFANIAKNYDGLPMLQKFFYRHYCKDDSVYGRLIEAAVDVWKNQGYRTTRSYAGEHEEIKVTQLRRSVDKTAMAQGHEPIAIKNILQADGVAYQAPEKSEYLSFFSEVSNLKADFDNYTFTFAGVTNYDAREVYEIQYEYKKDSVLTTSGYKPRAEASGSLFIDMDSYAFVKTEDLKNVDGNTLATSAYYHQLNGKYYPYHLIRKGQSITARGTHSFQIDLMSMEIRHDVNEKFVGIEPTKSELSKLAYDSVFWNTTSILKTTPLEDGIIHDLGGGKSLSEQFKLYLQYEYNLTDGGTNGEQKFNWLKEYYKGKLLLYVVFWSSDCKLYLNELEQAKRLQGLYRNKVLFVFLSTENDEAIWGQTVNRFSLFSEGMVQYRIGSNSKLLREYKVTDVPAFRLLNSRGDVVITPKHPSDPTLEKDFENLFLH